MARIGWFPTASVDVPHVALPPDRAAAAHKTVPLVVVNVTLPVGVPDPGAVAATFAVNVTPCPASDGLFDDITPTVEFD